MTTTEQQFIQEIVVTSRLGHGFVPFIGSGFSAFSGILMGQDFTNYLSYATFLSVHPRERWSLRRDGWPKQPTDQQISDARTWITEEFRLCCKRVGLLPIVDKLSGRVLSFNSEGEPSKYEGFDSFRLLYDRPNIPSIIQGPDLWREERELSNLRRVAGIKNSQNSASKVRVAASSQEEIRDHAIRSLHDWRITLDFLSRVDRDSSGRPVLLRKDTSIVDGFNVHITSDKQNNLGHKMLAHLVRVLRIRTILTTNFDDLIEQALHRVQNEFAVIPVSTKGSLPDPKTVRSHDCIIKLHGARLETRADLSLDEPPTNTDVTKFAEIVTGLKSKLVNGSFTSRSSSPNSILVIGFSGNDQRCIQLMRHAAETDPELKIFWVCHSTPDVKRISALFGEDELNGRIRICVSKRPDLLLYQLYQEIALCLPGGGFAYEYSHKAPPKRSSAVQASQLSGESKVLVERALLTKDASLHFPLAATIQAAGLSTQHRDVLPGLLVAQEVGRMVAEWHLGTSSPISIDEDVPLYRHARIKTLATNFTGDICLIVFMASGAMEAARIAYEAIEQKRSRKVISLELQDYTSPFQMMRDLFVTIALSQGLFQLEHVDFLPVLDRELSEFMSKLTDSEFQRLTQFSIKDAELQTTDDNLVKFLQFNDKLADHIQRIVDYLNIKPQEWVVLLYGRSYPGECSSWMPSVWDEAKMCTFLALLASLANLRRKNRSVEKGFNFVLFSYSKNRHEAEKRKKHEAIRIAQNWSPVASETEGEVRSTLNQYPADCFDHVNGNPSTPAFLDSLEKLEGNPAPVSAKSFYKSILNRVAREWVYAELYDPASTLEKTHFLYGLSLFRQSRHLSAFLSDGVFRCPMRFNILGVDNDELRHRKVTQWLVDLGGMGVILQKPGGYRWLHRDVRIGIQYLVQTADLKNLGVSDRVGYESFANVRSRMHYWIGDWYVKAFNSSGNAIPALESLHHFYSSAIYADWAGPRSTTLAPNANKDTVVESISPAQRTLDLIEYRKNLFTQSVVEIGKTLILAGDMLSFWLADGMSHEMFDRPAREKFSNDLKTQYAKICANSEPAETSSEPEVLALIDRVAFHLELIDSKITGRQGRRSEIACRVGTFSCNAYPDKPFAELVKSRESCVQWRNAIVGFCRDENHKFFEVDWIKQIVDEIKGSVTTTVNHDLLNPIAELSEYAKEIHTPRPWNDFVVLATNSAKTIDRKLRQAVSGTDILKDTIAVLESAAIVSELAYASLQRSKLIFHRDGLQFKKRPMWLGNAISSGTNVYTNEVFSEDFLKLSASWVQTTMLCNHGLRILRKLEPSQYAEGFRLQIKLHTLYGVALANLDRFSEAHRHVNEAMALGSKVSASLDSVEVGIVRMRRAEIYLTEAISLFNTVSECNNDEVFEKIFALLEGNQLESSNLPHRLETALLQVGTCLSAKEARPILKGILYRMAVSSFDDAWGMIEDAENGLAGRNRSSYWWGRLYTLQTRAFSLADSIKHDFLRAASYSGDIEKPRLLIERKTTQFDARRLDIYKKGRLTCGHRVFRNLRLADYMLGSEKTLETMVQEQDSVRRVWAEWIKIVLDDLNSSNMKVPDELAKYRTQLVDRAEAMRKIIAKV